MGELIEQMGNVYYQMYPMACHKVVTTISIELTIGVIGIILVIISATVCSKEKPWDDKWFMFLVVGIVGLLMSIGVLEAVYDYSNFDYWVTTTAIKMITGGTK